MAFHDNTYGGRLRPRRAWPSDGPPTHGRTTPPNLPPPRLDAWSWQLEARCLGYPSEVFFPEDVQQPSLHQREMRAIAICRECSVLLNCREYAMSAPETYGVWGALTAGERTRLRSGHPTGRPEYGGGQEAVRGPGQDDAPEGSLRISTSAQERCPS